MAIDKGLGSRKFEIRRQVTGFLDLNGYERCEKSILDR